MKKRARLFMAAMVLFGICGVAPVAAADSGVMAPVGAVGKFLDDSGITAEVKARILAEKGMEGSDISVTTTNSVVVLEGTVANDSQSELAQRLAGNLSNVKAVDNQLRVR